MESYVAYLIKDSDVPMVRDSAMVLNPTLNNISAIWWQPFLLVDDTGVPCENHWLAASYWQMYHIMLYQVYLAINRIRTQSINGDYTDSNKYNYHTITTVPFSNIVCYCKKVNIFSRGTGL